jgi:Outer membrane protein beta-barrel domain
MRKLIFCVLTFLITINGRSQNLENSDSDSKIRKGQVSVGLRGVPIYSPNENGSDIMGLGLSPNMGVFLSEHLSLENHLFFYYTDNLSIDGMKSRSSTVGILINLRYHFFLGRKWSLLADAGIGSAIITYQNKDSDPAWDVTELNSGALVYSVGIGAIYAISEKIDMEILLPYLLVQNLTNDRNTNYPYNGLAGPTIGIRYNF